MCHDTSLYLTTTDQLSSNHMVSSVGSEASAVPEGSEATTMVGGSHEEWDHVLEHIYTSSTSEPLS